MSIPGLDRHITDGPLCEHGCRACDVCERCEAEDDDHIIRCEHGARLYESCEECEDDYGGDEWPDASDTDDDEEDTCGG